MGYERIRVRMAMLDIQELRKRPEKVQENFIRRGTDISVEEILSLDRERLRLQTDVQKLRHEKNQLSKQVACRKKQGQEAEDLLRQIDGLGEKADGLAAALREKTEELQAVLIRLPNLLDDEIGERDEVLYQWKERPVFSFSPADHMELCKRLGLVDYETAGRLMGGGYWIYRGAGARLEWALLNFCLEENQKAGYEMLMLPPVAREQCGFGAGQFPKFSHEVFRIQESELFLIPTAETILVNLYGNQMLKESELPLKYTSYTPCFRKETSKNPKERGMVRGHQFNKVELAQITTPEQSDEAFGQILSQAEALMRRLELHYRVVKLAASECSFGMARTYDIQVWLPAEQAYMEVSSVSNAREYQARRTNTRYRDENGKIHHVHTLNGSGLATSRLFAAILEQNQEDDGHVRIPEVLVPRMGTNIL